MLSCWGLACSYDLANDIGQKDISNHYVTSASKKENMMGSESQYSFGGLFAKYDATRQGTPPHISSGTVAPAYHLDPATFDFYNNSFWMPLHEYIEHPAVQELVHNNQALQIVGLSNYSK